MHLNIICFSSLVIPIDGHITSTQGTTSNYGSIPCPLVAILFQELIEISISYYMNIDT
jgi:hypothetical protein